MVNYVHIVLLTTNINTLTTVYHNVLDLAHFFINKKTKESCKNIKCQDLDVLLG